MASIKDLNKSITEMEFPEASALILSVRERRFSKKELSPETKKKQEAKKEVIKKSKPKKILLAEAVDNLTPEQKAQILELLKGKTK